MCEPTFDKEEALKKGLAILRQMVSLNGDCHALVVDGLRDGACEAYSKAMMETYWKLDITLRDVARIHFDALQSFVDEESFEKLNISWADDLYREFVRRANDV